MKTYVDTGSQPLSAGAYYPQSDLLYRSEALTDASGDIEEAYDTDAYGNTLVFSGPGEDDAWFTDDDTPSDQPACEYIFTGREYDPESQIYFYRARYYHPPLGRFISRDPKDYVDGLNLYEYVRSHPTVSLDPNGTDCCGSNVTTKLPLISAAVVTAWNAPGLGVLGQVALALNTTLNPYTAINYWDITGMPSDTAGDASPCYSGTGQCAGTVTVSGKCYWQKAVNYWLGGVIDTIFKNYGNLYYVTFTDEAVAYTFLKGEIPTEKLLWFAAGAAGNTALVPAPAELLNCTPCTAFQKVLGWSWGSLGGTV
jgi:RHS repeat-associated protein